MLEIQVKTNSRSEFIDITSNIQKILDDNHLENGLIFLHVPHTTAGITVNEHADPSVVVDIKNALEKQIPWSSNYLHNEGNSAAHIKCSMINCSVAVAFEKGKLMLGIWQGIFFAEFDGPRVRKVWVKILKD
ncbi:MAG: YjbQ family protein [Candidatus Coatesbacteria bacterium]|nr:YjbQ family protein [Candidatus Coatesbacteria bacterium]